MSVEQDIEALKAEISDLKSQLETMKNVVAGLVGIIGEEMEDYEDDAYAGGAEFGRYDT
jgi:hypothetical protein